MDLILGVLGALLGGGIFRAIGAEGVTGFNMWSLLVALVGSVVLLAAWRALLRPARHV